LLKGRRRPSKILIRSRLVVEGAGHLIRQKVNGVNLKGKKANARSQEYQDLPFAVWVQPGGPRNAGVIHTAGNGCPVHGNPGEGVVLEVVDFRRGDYQRYGRRMVAVE
jgi:hypothetical protein